MTDKKPTFRIVLIEPEIPQNTGNIGRTCVATNCELHLVGKLGFEINDRNLKRAGLDYWVHLTWFHHATFEDWWKQVEDPSRAFYFTTKSQRLYTDVRYQPGDWLVFGKETKGLDPELIRRNAERAVKIPLLGPTRSLNLSTAVAIASYEGIRQMGPDLPGPRS
ncbi:MAG TPA: tRNA (cytidine(34)-2'-O)-methyltransferase [Pseudobdellovibrionaceae bacterium]|nr:tRNA (cytidine(34)-2'-O)-methyltransferase [Pseudobdellovibrionaceae bacterium]